MSWFMHARVRGAAGGRHCVLLDERGQSLPKRPPHPGFKTYWQPGIIEVMSGAFPRDGMDAAILRLYFEMTRSQQQAFLAAIERTVGGGQPFEEAMIEFLWDCGIAPTEARQTVQRAVTAESGGWRNTLN